MSLPSTGVFEAESSGLKLRFDGAVWTVEGPVSSVFEPILNRETPNHVGQHRTVDVVGRAVLQAVFGGDWRQIRVKAESWPEPLPEGGID